MVREKRPVAAAGVETLFGTIVIIVVTSVSLKNHDKDFFLDDVKKII